MTKCYRNFLVLAMLVGIAAQVTPVFAQSPLDPGSLYQKERQRVRDAERLRQSKAGRKIEIQNAEIVKREKICFPIERIKLRGVSVLQASVLKVVLDPYTGACMGQKAIGALVQKITNVYARKGFITTRVYVPGQNLKDRVLMLDVVEGRISGFAYRVIGPDGKTRPGNARKLRNAFPISPGDVFQLRDIEQGLDQINRLRSSNATVDLVPGKEPGTTLVVVTEKVSDRMRGYVGYNNTGANLTGRNRVSISLEADDLLGLGDGWNVSYTGSENTNGAVFGFSVPYGLWTFSANGSYFESVQALTATSDLFSQVGSISGRLEALVYRNSSMKLWGYGALGYYWNNRYVNISQLIPQNRTTVRAGVRQEHYIGKNVLSLDTALVLGIPLFGTDRDPVNPARTTPRAQFAKLEATLSYLQRFNSGAMLSFLVSGQYSKHALFSNEQINIGGWDTVRGYHEASQAGDMGFYTRNELYLAMPNWGDPTVKPDKSKNFARHFYFENKDRLQPYLFMDAGWARNVANRQNATMAGVGVGLNLVAGRLTMGAALALPLIDDRTNFHLGQPQGHLNVTLKLF